MSKQVATLLVGLLAFAEGRTNNLNYLREADRDDVLDEVSPDTLDRIAHRLYAQESENMSAYERLLKDDKRKKMDYINNIRPDLLPEDRRHHPAGHDYVDEELTHHAKDHRQDSHQRHHYDLDVAPVEQVEDVLRRTDETHDKLT